MATESYTKTEMAVEGVVGDCNSNSISSDNIDEINKEIVNNQELIQMESVRSTLKILWHQVQ